MNEATPQLGKAGSRRRFPSDLPFLGVGLGFRQEIKEDLLRYSNRIDFLEVMTEHYIDMPPHKRAEVQELAEVVPLVLHGVELSIGTFGSVDQSHLQKMRQVADWARAYWVSDHLCLTRVPGLAIGNLTPVPFSEASSANIIANARYAASSFDCPFLLENISYYFQPLPREMSEAEFISRVVEGADCYLLLDLTNVQNNAVNMNYDPYVFLDSVPLERVVQIHLAGGYYLSSVLLDTHSHPVPSDVFDLLRYVAPRMPNLRGILIERDQNFPPFGELLDELDQVRDVVRNHWGPYHADLAVQTPKWMVPYAGYTHA
ncbi:MAG: DUF692 domain-containing protein [Acidobacteriota bacterium]